MLGESKIRSRKDFGKLGFRSVAWSLTIYVNHNHKLHRKLFLGTFFSGSELSGDTSCHGIIVRPGRWATYWRRFWRTACLFRIGRNRLLTTWSHKEESRDRRHIPIPYVWSNSCGFHCWKAIPAADPSEFKKKGAESTPISSRYCNGDVKDAFSSSWFSFLFIFLLYEDSRHQKNIFKSYPHLC